MAQRARHADERQDADGEVAGSWPPDAEVALMRKHHAHTVANKPVTGETAYKP